MSSVPHDHVLERKAYTSPLGALEAKLRQLDERREELAQAHKAAEADLAAAKAELTGVLIGKGDVTEAERRVRAAVDRRDSLCDALVELDRQREEVPARLTAEREHIAPQQEARFEADVWEETIGTFLAGKRNTTVGEIARYALHIETPRIGTTDQRRISAAFERLGWERGDKNWRGNIPWAPPAPFREAAE